MAASSDVLIVDDHPGVERQEPFGRREQGIDVNLLDPALLDDQIAKTDEQLLERRQVHRPPAANPSKRRENLGLLHHPAGQGAIERRQAEGAILDDLDQLATRAEEKNRAELGVEAAADDQLITVERDHRLNTDPLEMLGTGAAADRRLDGVESTSDAPPHRECRAPRRQRPSCG